jgi:hypothetical protein
VRVVCFSSFSFSYLNRARVLFASLRRHNPDWYLVALITDRPPPGFSFDQAAESFDEVVYASELLIPSFEAWLFTHDVVEACTAVKGPYLQQACFSGFDIVVYLDPDTAVFSSMRWIEAELATADILLTPHTLDTESEPEAIEDNEIAPLLSGIYNLGFLAVRARGQGLRFSSWWCDRLLEHCYDDSEKGLFVDQRWCDHAPVFFDRVKIVRDPGCNVASWNINHRSVEIRRDGRITVNGADLKFWHFTKLGELGDAMTRKYAKDNYNIYEIWNWYRRSVEDASDARIPDGYWAYATYADGSTIPSRHRRTYRKRQTLQAAFPNPFESGPGTLQAWMADSERRRGLLALAPQP